MSISTQPYKGTRDFYPKDLRKRRYLYQKFSEILNLYGYEEYDGPLLESFDLYAAKTGEEIVNKQLYHFEDRGGRKVAIRPEMTPTLARMVAARLEEIPKPLRWYSFPNLWRYERPQRGRLREHWQLNVDIMGGQNPQSEVEILGIAARIMDALGGLKFVEFRVNDRAFVNHVFSTHLGLDSASSLAFSKLLDAKDKMPPEEFQERIDQLGLDSTSKELAVEYMEMNLESATKKFACPEIEQLAKTIKLLNSEFGQELVIFDPKIMRGLDYYTGLVFEAFDKSPENPRALFGGGRYDNLIGLFHSKKSLSGLGFGMGDVVLGQFLETHGLSPTFEPSIDIYLGATEADQNLELGKLATQLRSELGFSLIAAQEASKIKTHLQNGLKHEVSCVGWINNPQSWSLKWLKTQEQWELPVQGFVESKEFQAFLEKFKYSRP